jgi:hypothetical protein
MERSSPPPKLVLAQLERIARHLPDGTDLTLITLKGHLLVEELLDSIIEDHCKDKTVLQGVEISFFLKIRLAAALTGRDDVSFAWTMGEKLNALRNALAHKLEHPLAQKRLATFLALFRNQDLDLVPTGEQSKDLRRAIIFLIGCLTAIKSGPPSSAELTIDA